MQYAVLPAFFAAAMGKATPEAQILHPNLALAGAAPLAAHTFAAAPALHGIVNEGPVSGPLTPVVGGAVATPRGYANLALEGFSEDINGDGFVDPIAPAALHAAAPVAVAAAPFNTFGAVPAAAYAGQYAGQFAGFPTLNGALAPLPLSALPVEVAAPVEVAHAVQVALPAPAPIVEHVQVVHEVPTVVEHVAHPVAHPVHHVAHPVKHVAHAKSYHHQSYPVHHSKGYATGYGYGKGYGHGYGYGHNNYGYAATNYGHGYNKYNKGYGYNSYNRYNRYNKGHGYGYKNYGYGKQHGYAGSYGYAKNYGYGYKH